MIRFKLFILILISIIFTSCKLDSAKYRDNLTVFNGLWRGVQEINGVKSDIELLSYNNKFYGYSVTSNILFMGNGYINKKHFNGSYKVYTIDTFTRFGDGTFNGYVNSSSRVTGDFKNSLGQEGSFNLKLDKDNFYKSSSIDKIATSYNGSYYNFTIDKSGIIAGTLGDCNMYGRVVIPDNSINIYQITLRLEDCSYEGYYNGLGRVVENQENNFYMFFGNDKNMGFFKF